MRGKLVVAVAVASLMGAACTADVRGEGGGVGPIPPETLLLGTRAGPLVVQIPSGSVLFERPGTVASLGGSWLLSATRSSGSTVLEAVDGADATPSSTIRLNGALDVRVVSETGGAVALMDPLPAGWDPQVPLPRSRTSIVVADPTGAVRTRTYDLRGNFEPEAFSTDDRRLFMIQHLPAEAPTVYRVTVLDLRSGRVEPVLGPFKGPAERMPGIRLQQVLSPNADQLYTLYSSARPGYAPHHVPVPTTATVSFVHVLSLQDGWAHCVGLPKQLWDRPASEQAMAPSPDGRLLYVVDPTLGLVTAMDTETLEIVRATSIDLSVEGVTRTSAVVSADGSALFVATSGERPGIARIDTDTFDVVRTWATGDVSGLGLSADGRRLYAASDGRVEVLDATTGSELAGVAVASPAPIDRVSVALAS